MVGTRWNVMDPLGRVETEKKNNPRYRFRKIPALNENGESNFDYDYGVGFSTKYYVDMKSRLDANEWQAKYQQNPFIREGILFPEDGLRYYNGILPEGDSRVVTELIRRVRKKLAEYTQTEYIETVWGMGYRWKR